MTEVHLATVETRGEERASESGVEQGEINPQNRR
jgi:hypothetical protein